MHLYGLVPDGVARVVAAFYGGTTKTVDAHDR
jgi:hypothetical protein